MKLPTRAMVCSASPDYINNNSILRKYVYSGFVELLGSTSVLESTLDSAVFNANIFNPDFIIIFGSCMPYSVDYNALKIYAIKNNKIIIFWLHDDPYEFDFNEKIYDYADYIFTNDKWASYHIKQKFDKVHHLPLAADYSSHYREIKSSFDRDIFFCGVGFPNRNIFMRELSKVAGDLSIFVVGEGWDTSVEFCNNARIPNNELPDWQSCSLVTINLGRRFNLANDRYQLDPTTPGPRTFETAMSGCTQIALDDCIEMGDYFDDSQIITVKNAKELVSKVNYLKSNIDLRNQYAINAQNHTIHHHSYVKRAQFILDVI